MVTTQFDELNRPTSKLYVSAGAGTPTVYCAYDDTTVPNGFGRLAKITAGIRGSVLRRVVG